MTDRRLPPTLHVEPWVDPVVDALGHDPRSGYVERFWLGVLGPSAVWLLRHLADRLDREPDGLDLDVVATGRAIGLGSRSMTSLSHTVGRLATFGQARFEGADTLAVRRRLPPLSRRQVEHLPEPLRAEHADAPALSEDEVRGVLAAMSGQLAAIVAAESAAVQCLGAVVAE